MPTGASAHFLRAFPLDTGLIRGVINNAIHLHEQSGQVRVKCVAGNGNIANLAGGTANLPRRMIRVPFHPRLRHDGAPFLFRVRLAGKANASNTQAYRLVIAGGAAECESIVFRNSGTDTRLATVTGITSTTAAWLTLSRTVLTLTRDDVAYQDSAPGRSATGLSASDETTYMPRLFVEVWGINDTGGGAHFLNGLVVEEFHG